MMVSATSVVTAAATTASEELRKLGGLISELQENTITATDARLQLLANKYPYEIVSWAYSSKSVSTVEDVRKQVFLQNFDRILQPQERFGGLLAAFGEHCLYYDNPRGKDVRNRLAVLAPIVGKGMKELPTVGWEHLRSCQCPELVCELPQFFPDSGCLSYLFHLVHTKPGNSHRVINIEAELQRIEVLLRQLLQGKIDAANPELNQLATDFGDAISGMDTQVLGFLKKADKIKNPELIALRKKFPIWFPS